MLLWENFSIWARAQCGTSPKVVTISGRCLPLRIFFSQACVGGETLSCLKWKWHCICEFWTKVRIPSIADCFNQYEVNGSTKMWFCLVAKKSLATLFMYISSVPNPQSVPRHRGILQHSSWESLIAEDLWYMWYLMQLSDPKNALWSIVCYRIALSVYFVEKPNSHRNSLFMRACVP